MLQGIKRVEMEIELADGTIVKGSLTANGDSARWGSDVPHLGACVYPMQMMSDALHAGDCWVRKGES